MDISIALLDLIHDVTNALDQHQAQRIMLSKLMEIFDLDQAAICVKKQGNISIEFAIDRTKRILPKDATLWKSGTIIEQAIETARPQSFQGQPESAEAYGHSLHEYSLKNVLCIPVDHQINMVVYLASQRLPTIQFTDLVMKNAMAAGKSCALALRQFHNLSGLKEQNKGLQESLSHKSRHFLYCSSEIEDLMGQVRRIAPFNISTFIYGESGTGKEELAKEIHAQSERKGPFVAINCATLTETLLESELFGYVKGAFTGAVRDKQGLFQEANGGTLFLDEIAEIPINLQSKLLRAIQERSIRPLGSNKSIPVDIRIISASLKNLDQCVAKGTFREDLFYRVNEISFTIPPLRERVSDIELLAKHFIKEFCEEYRFVKKDLGEQALQKLRSYPLPGNVRELKNLCRSSVILCQKATITPCDIRLPEQASNTPSNVVEITPSQDSPKLDQSDESTTYLNSSKLEDIVNEVSTTGKTLKDIRKDYDRLIIEGLMKSRNMTQEAVALELGVSVRTIQRIIQ